MIRSAGGLDILPGFDRFRVAFGVLVMFWVRRNPRPGGRREQQLEVCEADVKSGPVSRARPLGTSCRAVKAFLAIGFPTVGRLGYFLQNIFGRRRVSLSLH